MPKLNYKQRWVDRVWYKRSWFSFLLLPLALVYWLVTSVRKHIYYQLLYPVQKYECPIIIVGNISVGGTGKTPMVIHLCQQLQQLGYHPAVTSRGYGVKLHGSRLVTDTDKAMHVGDEPALIRKRTQVPVMVGPDRKASIQQLIAQQLCDVIICDDGLQDYRFVHDLEICMIDAERMYGNALLIPAGPLREGIKRTLTCDFIVATGQTVPALSADAMTTQIGEVVSLSDEQESFALDNWQNQTLHAVAGIGHPQRFFRALREYNITVIEHVFADHAVYNKSDLQFGDHLPVLMTEKDAVKCLEFNLPNSWYVKINAFTNESLIKRIDSKLREHDG